MKGKLSLTILTTIIVIMISAVTTIALSLLQQYPQRAQAFPCNGDNGKEYCTGYHDEAIQAHKDFKTGDDMDVGQHRCTGSEEYCNGCDRGYSDEEDLARVKKLKNLSRISFGRAYSSHIVQYH